MSWFKTDEKAALDLAVRDTARPATRLDDLPRAIAAARESERSST